jgi:hypothetical protein
MRSVADVIHHNGVITDIIDPSWRLRHVTTTYKRRSNVAPKYAGNRIVSEKFPQTLLRKRRCVRFLNPSHTLCSIKGLVRAALPCQGLRRSASVILVLHPDVYGLLRPKTIVGVMTHA